MTRKFNKRYYNITNTCDNIKKVGFSWGRCEEKLNPGKANREKDKDGNWTGKWICVDCYRNCYNLPFDHSQHNKLGIIQTKGTKLIVTRQWILKYEKWSKSVINEHNKEFDNLVLYCLNKEGKIIERIYIFPISEIACRSSIEIYKYSKGWYEKHICTNEEFLNNANNVWTEIYKEYEAVVESANGYREKED
jgi:hypothetical protein